MEVRDPDDLVPFADVRVLSAAGPAMLCRIGRRQVWLPRNHISGNLRCVGDRGTLLIRRWVALERHLLATESSPLASSAASLAPRRATITTLRPIDGGARHAH